MYEHANKMKTGGGKVRNLNMVSMAEIDLAQMIMPIFERRELVAISGGDASENFSNSLRLWK